MKKLFFMALSLALMFSGQVAMAQAVAGDDLVGLWEPSSGKGRVKIERIGDKYYGKVVWLREPIDPETKQKKVDKNNPDPALKVRPRLGLRVIKNFTFANGIWEDGTIYDPENGSTYNSKIEMKDKNTIELRGYIGTPMFGRTDVWKRMK